MFLVPDKSEESENEVNPHMSVELPRITLKNCSVGPSIKLRTKGPEGLAESGAQDI
jgi:hypothetical protein